MWASPTCTCTENEKLSVHIYTVKPLITDPPKSGLPLYSGQITFPRLISEPPRSGHLSTPYSEHWWIPDLPWSIQNYLRKRTVSLQCERLSNAFVRLCATVAGFKTGHYVAPSHRVQPWGQTNNGYLCTSDTQRWSFPLYLQTTVSYVQMAIGCLFCYCINVSKLHHSTFHMQVVLLLPSYNWKKTIKRKYMHRIYCNNTF